MCWFFEKFAYTLNEWSQTGLQTGVNSHLPSLYLISKKSSFSEYLILKWDFNETPLPK